MKIAHGEQGRPKPKTQMHECHMDDNCVPVVEDGEGVKRGRRDRLLLHRASVSGESLDWLHGRATADQLRDRLDLICFQLHELSPCTCIRELGRLPVLYAA